MIAKLYVEGLIKHYFLRKKKNIYIYTQITKLVNNGQCEGDYVFQGCL